MIKAQYEVKDLILEQSVAYHFAMSKKRGRSVREYKWYRYMWIKPIVFAGAHFKALQTFGIREATSEHGKVRIVLNQTGLGMVYTLNSQQRAALIARSEARSAPKILTFDRLSENGRILAKELAKIKVNESAPIFWRVVRIINFPKLSRSKSKSVLREAKLAINLSFEKQQIETFARWNRDLADKLKESVEKLEKQAGEQLFHGGDDSLEDAAAFAISSGSTLYFKFLKSPNKFIEHFNEQKTLHDDFSDLFSSVDEVD